MAPEGFQVELYDSGLDNPRLIRRAPNGDLFLAETHKGEIKVYRGVTKEGKPAQSSIYATGLQQPFGIAFYPQGENPQWLYIGNTNSVVRFAYKNGELKASGAPQVLIPELASKGGHSTRDVAFSLDGKRMFVSVGSRSNVDDADTHPAEFHRANILEYTPEGKFVKIYGAGIRNPVGIAVHPQTGELWCSVNERDALGDNLVPDYITHVRGGRILRLAVVLHGQQSRPAPRRETPRAQGQGDRARCAAAAALRVSGDDLLRRQAIPAGVPGRDLRGGAWLVESQDSAPVMKSSACR